MIEKPTSDDTPANENKSEEKIEEQSFFKMIVHSFFVIPFLITVFCLILFASMRLLTNEKRSAYDYLEDIKVGGASKRWQGAYFLSRIERNKKFQGAFELSKILSNPKFIPDDDRFNNELINAFENSVHDDNRVRQYLALSMGRTGRSEFVQPLLDGLKNEKEENVPALIYALGMIQDSRALDSLYEYVDHPDERIRSITVVAIGNIADLSSKSILKKALKDSQANVQWGAAISLANMKDDSGRAVLLDLLDRNYLSQHEEVDPDEATGLLLAAIAASENLDDFAINKRLEELSLKDKNMNVRSAALKTLEKIND